MFNTLQGTVSSGGRPLSVIDGRDLSKTALTVNGASHVTIRGFDIRRGTLYVNQADNVSVLNSRIHSSISGISIAYSNYVQVVGCKVFDNTEGAQADGIALHRGVDHASQLQCCCVYDVHTVQYPLLAALCGSVFCSFVCVAGPLCL